MDLNEGYGLVRLSMRAWGWGTRGLCCMLGAVEKSLIWLQSSAFCCPPREQHCIFLGSVWLEALNSLGLFLGLLSPALGVCVALGDLQDFGSWWGMEGRTCGVGGVDPRVMVSSEGLSSTP